LEIWKNFGLREVIFYHFYYLVDFFNYKLNNIQNVKSTNQQEIKQINNLESTQSVDDIMKVLPDVTNKSSQIIMTEMPSTDENYIPKLVDRSIRLPVSKVSSEYNKVKSLIKEHIEYSGLELDFHKLELSKDHIEAAIYYLRNIIE
jgi:hypothetical protein